MSRPRVVPGAASTSGRLLRPLALLAAVFALGQMYYFLVARLPPILDDLAGLLLPLATIGLFVAWTRWDRRPLSAFGLALPARLTETLLVGILLTVVFIVATLEAGLAFGFFLVPQPAPTGVAFWLVFAPITAIAGEVVYRGYLLDRWLVPGRAAIAFGTSSALFAIGGTNWTTLGVLDPVDLVRFLLTNTLLLFVLGLVLALYYFRSGRNLVGPIVLRTGLLLFTGLSPVLARTSGWEFTFLLELFAYALVLGLLTALVRPTRLAERTYLGATFGARRNRFLGVASRRHRLQATAVLSAVVVLLVLAGFVALERTLGTARPILAIESGSMVPAFHRGDLVVVAHADPSTISLGTIIAFTSTCMPSPVVHRVVAIHPTAEGPVYTTRGDANPVADPCTVPYGAVEGRVVAVLPVLGYFVLSPVLAVGLIALGAIVAYLLEPEAPTRFPKRRWVS